MNTRLSLPIYACVIFLRNDSILLLKRSNTGYLDGSWAIPGGSLDPNETVVVSAIREMKEELNVSIKPEDLSLAHVLHIYPPTGSSLGFYFIASTWQGEPENVEVHKHADMRWFPLNRLPDQLAPAACHIIEYLRTHKGLQFSIHK
jgi:8-oxo-dGTP pyrophosphatase MutT (NUDIX family)